MGPDETRSGIDPEDMGEVYGALWKLKDYEDTGKSPEEIECMDK